MAFYNAVTSTLLFGRETQKLSKGEKYKQPDSVSQGKSAF